MKLYSYWRSSTAYRTRIALNLKGLAFETIAVDLVKGDQHAQDYTALNPVAGVPTLLLDDGTVLTQSMAILDYLDTAYPNPSFLSDDPLETARIRAAAMIIASEVHPLNNTRVIKHLKGKGFDDAETVEWMRYWMGMGLSAFQALLPQAALCFSDHPTLADICLIPQLYNAHRWGLDLTPFGRLTEIEARCLELPESADAIPERQPDAPKANN